MKTIIDTATDAGKFTTLLNALKAASLTEMLRGAGPYTVFAPTDEAFKHLAPGALNALLKDTKKLKTILTYHVVPGRVAAKDVKAGDIKTLEGTPLMATLDGAKVTVTTRSRAGGYRCIERRHPCDRYGHHPEGHDAARGGVKSRQRPRYAGSLLFPHLRVSFFGVTDAERSFYRGPYAPSRQLRSASRPFDANGAVSSDDPPTCTDADSDIEGAILVEASRGEPVGGLGDKASLTISRRTTAIWICGPTDALVPGSFGDLVPGQAVSAWVDGPVAESIRSRQLRRRSRSSGAAGTRYS